MIYYKLYQRLLDITDTEGADCTGLKSNGKSNGDSLIT